MQNLDFLRNMPKIAHSINQMGIFHASILKALKRDLRNPIDKQ